MADKNLPKRILIVEDDDDDFLITSELILSIKTIDSVVEWSHNYDEALSKMVSQEYDIYFVDYQLGIKTGMNLLEEALKNGCEVPIVLLTGNGTSEMDIKAIEIGAYDFLNKSELNAEKLERCIRYSLERAISIQALKANEKKYRSIFEKSKEVIFICTNVFRILDINYAATDLFQYELEEFKNLNLLYLIKEEKDQKFFAETLEESGEIFDYETALICKNKEIKTGIISASIEFNNLGVKYIQGVIHDNTARKKAEKATLQAEKMAATGRLLRTLAHEVRNPLNNINLSLKELMHHPINKDEDRLFLEIIERSSNKIGDLITELLDSFRMPPLMKSEKASLQTTMDDAIAASMDRITLKQIELIKNYPQNEPFALIDSDKIKFVFINIIINAIEAMHKGEGCLTISINSSLEEHFVEIADNGCGISEENIQKLFEPYFTTKNNGMGLGLSATMNIIQSHNAQIAVTSIVGKGTTFTLTFKQAQ